MKLVMLFDFYDRKKFWDKGVDSVNYRKKYRDESSSA